MPNQPFDIKIELPLPFDGLIDAVNRQIAVALKEIDQKLLNAVANEFRKPSKYGTPGIASGRTLDDITSRSQVVGSRYTIEISPTSRQAAMQAIELGRRRNKPQPPIESILEWMRARGIGAGESEAKQKQIAFAISHSISQNGIQPKFIFAKALESQISAIQETLQKAVANGIAEYESSNRLAS
jgi:hypothetical protein